MLSLFLIQRSFVPHPASCSRIQTVVSDPSQEDDDQIIDSNKQNQNLLTESSQGNRDKEMLGTGAGARGLLSVFDSTLRIFL